MLIGVLVRISERAGKDSGKIVFTSGDVNPVDIGVEYPDNEGLLGWVIRKNQSLMVDDFAAKENYIPRLFLNEHPAEDLKSLLAVPVLIDEEAQVVISVESRKPR